MARIVKLPKLKLGTDVTIENGIDQLLLAETAKNLCNYRDMMPIMLNMNPNLIIHDSRDSLVVFIHHNVTVNNELRWRPERFN